MSKNRQKTYLKVKPHTFCVKTVVLLLFNRKNICLRIGIKKYKHTIGPFFYKKYKTYY